MDAVAMLSARGQQLGLLHFHFKKQALQHLKCCRCFAVATLPEETSEVNTIAAVPDAETRQRHARN
eukprot:SAG31_NODE_12445_length_942_cov_0.763938_1_plen_66_part_00